MTSGGKIGGKIRGNQGGNWKLAGHDANNVWSVSSLLERLLGG